MHAACYVTINIKCITLQVHVIVVLSLLQVILEMECYRSLFSLSGYSF